MAKKKLTLDVIVKLFLIDILLLVAITLLLRWGGITAQGMIASFALFAGAVLGVLWGFRDKLDRMSAVRAMLICFVIQVGCIALYAELGR